MGSPANTFGYPSSLNVQFLLSSGNYNSTATGVPWFKHSLFFLLPFLQKFKAMPHFETQTISSTHFTQTMQYSTNNIQTVLNIAQLRSRPHVPDPIAQVRPQFLPNAYRNASYCTLPLHN